MTSTYVVLHYKISKASDINICQTQGEVYKLLYLPRRTSDNLKLYLGHIEVGGSGAM